MYVYTRKCMYVLFMQARIKKIKNNGYTYTHIYMYTHTHINTCIRAYIHAVTCHTHIHTCIHTYIHTCSHTSKIFSRSSQQRCMPFQKATSSLLQMYQSIVLQPQHQHSRPDPLECQHRAYITMPLPRKQKAFVRYSYVVMHLCGF